MDNINLNLARKWRSKNFDTIIGQELSVKMLKNSLYLGHLFPVYLFAGQRGCGKTTTARVFAAAINCERLPEFQRKPQHIAVPCLTCSSCKAMLEGRHPDFIEMDAASHTGVDNVRSIIDAASFLPVMGNKKIYLIDEAHMLSKAAFNALLKILEEPPASVLFILATTDPHKIIDTVTSRCFQVWFKPVETEQLATHLAHVCEHEQISFERDGLEAIIKASSGSVRDALNLVEQVRFSHGAISQKSVRDLLGYMDDDQALHLFALLLTGTPPKLLTYMHESSLAHFSSEVIWRKLVQLVREALWLVYGNTTAALTKKQAETLRTLVQAVSIERLHALASFLYEHEKLFMHTSMQYELLEMLLVRICHDNDDSSSSGTAGASSAPKVVGSDDSVCEDEVEEEDAEHEDEEEEEIIEDDAQKFVGTTPKEITPWQSFLQALEREQEPLLISIFGQAVCDTSDQSAKKMAVVFPKNLVFFEDWLHETKKTWQPLFHAVYGQQKHMVFDFTGQEVKKAPAAEAVVSSKAVASKKELERETRPCDAVSFNKPKQKPAYKSSRSMSTSSKPQSSCYVGVTSAMLQKSACPLDVSDRATWEKTAMVLDFFPGTVTEITATSVEHATR